MSSPAGDRTPTHADHQPISAEASAEQLGSGARVRPDPPSQSVPPSGGQGGVSSAAGDGSQVAQTVGSSTLRVPPASDEATNADSEPLPARTPDHSIDLTQYMTLTPADWARVLGDDLMNRIMVETNPTRMTRGNTVIYYSQIQPRLTQAGFNVEVLTKDVFIHSLFPKIRIYYEQMKSRFEAGGLAKGLPEYRGIASPTAPVVPPPATEKSPGGVTEYLDSVISATRSLYGPLAAFTNDMAIDLGVPEAAGTQSAEAQVAHPPVQMASGHTIRGVCTDGQDDLLNNGQTEHTPPTDDQLNRMAEAPLPRDTEEDQYALSDTESLQITASRLNALAINEEVRERIDNDSAIDGVKARTFTQALVQIDRRCRRRIRDVRSSVMAEVGQVTSDVQRYKSVSNRHFKHIQQQLVANRTIAENHRQNLDSLDVQVADLYDCTQEQEGELGDMYGTITSHAEDMALAHKRFMQSIDGTLKDHTTEIHALRTEKNDFAAKFPEMLRKSGMSADGLTVADMQTAIAAERASMTEFVSDLVRDYIDVQAIRVGNPVASSPQEPPPTAPVPLNPPVEVAPPPQPHHPHQQNENVNFAPTSFRREKRKKRNSAARRRHREGSPDSYDDEYDSDRSHYSQTSGAAHRRRRKSRDRQRRDEQRSRGDPDDSSSSDGSSADDEGEDRSERGSRSRESRRRSGDDPRTPQGSRDRADQHQESRHRARSRSRSLRHHSRRRGRAPAIRIKTIRDDIGPFKGHSGEDFPNYASRFEAYMRRHRVPREHWGQYMCDTIDLRAYGVLEDLTTHDRRVYKYVKRKLTACYPKEYNSTQMYQVEWASIAQGPKEDLQTYGARIEKIASRANPEIDEDSLQKMKGLKFRMGLVDGTLRHRLQCRPDVQRFHKMVTTAVEMLAESDHAEGKLTPRHAIKSMQLVEELNCADTSDSGVPQSVASDTNHQPKSKGRSRGRRQTAQNPTQDYAHVAAIQPARDQPQGYARNPQPAYNDRNVQAQNNPNEGYNDQQPPRNDQNDNRNTYTYGERGQRREARADGLRRYFQGANMAEMTCFNCYRLGHLAAQCPNPRAPNPNGNQNTNQRQQNNDQGQQGGGQGQQANPPPPPLFPPNRPSQDVRNQGHIKGLALHQQPAFIETYERHGSPNQQPNNAQGAQNGQQAGPSNNAQGRGGGRPPQNSQVHNSRMMMASSSASSTTSEMSAYIMGDSAKLTMTMPYGFDPANRDQQCRYVSTKREYPTAPIVPLKVGGHEVIALCDSAASLTTASPRLAQVLVKAGLSKIEETSERVQAFDNRTVMLKAFLMVPFDTDYFETRVKAYIVPDTSFDIALGNDFFEETGASMNWRSKLVRLGEVVTPFLTTAQVFQRFAEVSEWFAEIERTGKVFPQCFTSRQLSHGTQSTSE